MDGICFLLLMHKKEKVIFLFPSHIAYGYHGDDKKIGTNQPLLCTVTLHNFISEEAFKKEIQFKETTPTPAKQEITTPIKPTDTLTN